MLQPFLRTIGSYKQGELLKYFLGLFFLFGIIRPTRDSFVQNPLILSLINKIPMDLMGYAGHMILGYYFANTNRLSYHPMALFALYALSVAICTVSTQMGTLAKGDVSIPLHDYFSLTTFIEAISLFLLFKQINWEGAQGVKKLIYQLSSLTLGLYLFHPFLINKLSAKLGFTTISFNSFLAIPAKTLLIIALAFLTTYIMGKIPLVRRFWRF